MVLWVIAGIGISLLMGLSQYWTVFNIQPNRLNQATLFVLAGFYMRIGFTAAILVFAFRQEFWHGLAALAGIWIGRWIFLIYWNR